MARRFVPAFLQWAAVVILTMVGCSRAFWRQQADDDAYSLTGQKLNDQRWNLPRLDLQPDPRSRFFDPYDPDTGPLPPDDPSAHVFMHNVDGIEGYESWHEVGDALSIENPQWLEPYGLTEADFRPADSLQPRKRPVIDNLTLAQSLELSYIHNRDYQTQIEDLYAVALQLSLERFRFNVRLGLAVPEPSTDLTASTSADGTSSLSANSRMGVSQLLPGGAQWIVEIANNTLWLFSGPNQASSASILSFSLVQPLLERAGRRFTLEALTQSERNVLYKTRDLARFRQRFFADTVAGGTGFLDVLQQLQNVENQRLNIARVEDQLDYARTVAARKPNRLGQQLDQLPDGLVIPEALREQLEFDPETKHLYWTGAMTVAQEKLLANLSNDPVFRLAALDLIRALHNEVRTQNVVQLESRLVSSQLALVRAERGSKDVLDSFKLQLGLPPDLDLSLDESLLDPFELIDPRLSTSEAATRSFVDDWAALTLAEPSMEQLRTVADGLDKLAMTIQSESLDVVTADFQKLKQRLEGSSSYDRDEVAKQRALEALAQDERAHTDSKNDLNREALRIVALKKELTNAALPPARKTAIISDLGTIREQLLKVTQNLQVVQIGTRVDQIELAPFNMSMEEAIRLALDNRLDLMNARARVMDARRFIEIRANELEGVLDVVVDGAVLEGGEHTFRAGLAFTAPLDQIDERNNYRQALINYQRARRDFIELEDQVKLQVRTSWRQLNQIQDNFDSINRRSVRLAARQYDIAVETAGAPGQSSANAFSLLDALRNVLDAQNTLIQDWTNFERTRIRFYRDIGIMEIDERGLWNDDVYRTLRERDDEQQLAPPPAPGLLDVNQLETVPGTAIAQDDSARASHDEQFRGTGQNRLGQFTEHNVAGGYVGSNTFAEPKEGQEWAIPVRGRQRQENRFDRLGDSGDRTDRSDGVLFGNASQIAVRQKVGGS